MSLSLLLVSAHLEWWAAGMASETLAREEPGPAQEAGRYVELRRRGVQSSTCSRCGSETAYLRRECHQYPVSFGTARSLDCRANRRRRSSGRHLNSFPM